MAVKRLHGVVHCHSDHSFDGQCSYAELRAFFEARGVSFVCITEHIEHLDQEKVDAILRACESHSDGHFRFLPGIEMDYFKIYFIGLRGASVDFSSHEAQFNSLYPDARMCVFAHPIKARYRYPQWLIDRCDAVEILNTRYDGRHYFRPQSERLLRSVRRSRPGAVAVAGMDFHRPGDDSAVHLVLERHIPLTDDAIVEEIRSGRFDIHLRGARLCDMSASERALRRARIHVMDLGHGFNRRMANLGISLPHRIKRLLRRGMEGA